MSELTLNRILDSLVGAGLMAHQNMSTLTEAKYPVSNIKRNKTTGDVTLEIALAGIDPENISLKQKPVEQGSGKALFIEYNKNAEDSEKEDEFEYGKKDIAKRSFKAFFVIPVGYELDPDDITFFNGLLSIKVKKVEKEEDEEVVLSINTKKVKPDYR